MKINELIKAVTKDYMPIKKTVIQAQKEGRELSDEEKNTYFELNTTLEFYKIIKGLFVEEFTKNEALVEYLVGEEKLTLRQEKVKDKDGNEVTVSIVNEPMDARVDMMPEEFYKPLFEKLVKGHKENIDAFKARNDIESLKKEEIELKILESYLPKEATREDIMNYINEYYPNGIEAKGMGKVIGEVKKAFERANGSLVAECVKSKIV